MYPADSDHTPICRPAFCQIRWHVNLGTLKQRVRLLCVVNDIKKISHDADDTEYWSLLLYQLSRSEATEMSSCSWPSKDRLRRRLWYTSKLDTLSSLIDAWSGNVEEPLEFPKQSVSVQAVSNIPAI